MVFNDAVVGELWSCALAANNGMNEDKEKIVSAGLCNYGCLKCGEFDKLSADLVDLSSQLLSVKRWREYSCNLGSESQSFHMTASASIFVLENLKSW